MSVVSDVLSMSMELWTFVPHVEFWLFLFLFNRFMFCLVSFMAGFDECILSESQNH